MPHFLLLGALVFSVIFLSLVLHFFRSHIFLKLSLPNSIFTQGQENVLIRCYELLPQFLFFLARSKLYRLFYCPSICLLSSLSALRPLSLVSKHTNSYIIISQLSIKLIYSQINWLYILSQQQKIEINTCFMHIIFTLYSVLNFSIRNNLWMYVYVCALKKFLGDNYIA